ncbi:lipopolysaccharide-processing protein LpsZ (plasmid) [Sinorhizobium americanum]|uniref:Lipopolysaccharide-processing protein LpsZ n=2 Tax=Sinorhizobium americanum TaxID=194963 RepID=A0A1L3LZ65_9HYPH|nr:lipopolysaccharide-processing protein LpsZ [Sinorhizobium americanum]
MLSHRRLKQENREKARRPFTLVIGLAPWRNLLALWLPGRRLLPVSRDVQPVVFFPIWAPLLLLAHKPEVVVWGFKHPRYIARFCRRFNIPLIRLEDGFIRSVGLGAARTPPFSICMDRRGIYFDPMRPSDLEHLLETYDFAANQDLMSRARIGIEGLIGSGISKYNASIRVDIERLYGPKTKKRVLVLGQVEGDMSIIKGVDRSLDNNDAVRIAAEENPNAQIIYKPHPEVLRRTRTEPRQSDPREVQDIALVLGTDVALADALTTIDHVYTLTSLSGFEALLRGIKVTCLGMPFYAGWGATDDRQRCSRRTARRSPEEIFAAAYLLYPRYFDPIGRRAITFEEALNALARAKA